MDEFRICPNCGYARGFHASFRKEKEGMRVIFICPECGSSYDIGLIETRVDRLDPERGESF